MLHSNIKLDSDATVITVNRLNQLTKNLLDSSFPLLWVRGEISGFKRYSHLYFDLKDDKAKISCVMFASYLPLVDFELSNGQQVEVRGRVTLYPANGSYQINVERIRKVGQGELWEAYLRLFEKLRSEGLFDAKYKQKLPIFPKAIGVITSKEGAVIRDVVTTLKRRNSHIPVVIYHTLVQGGDAGMQIAKMIQVANLRNEVEVLIVCRGGGSMEDLWCFNQEIVAREVFASKIPIISAVGHETDTTIIDYVADYRAPTPTAAAEIVAKSKEEWLKELLSYYQNLGKIANYKLNGYRQQIDLIGAKLAGLSPIRKLELKLHKLSSFKARLRKAYLDYLKASKLNLDQLTSQLSIKMKQTQQVKQNRLNLLKIRVSSLKSLKMNLLLQHQQVLSGLSKLLESRINSKFESAWSRLNNTKNSLCLLNPENIVKRGYVIVRGENGLIITQKQQFCELKTASLMFKDGVTTIDIARHLDHKDLN